MTWFVFARSASLILSRVLVTLLSFCLSLSALPLLLSPHICFLSMSLAPSLLHSDSVYSTLCHSVLAWCLCNWDCIFCWRGTWIIAQAALHFLCPSFSIFFCFWRTVVSRPNPSHSASSPLQMISVFVSHAQLAARSKEQQYSFLSGGNMHLMNFL